MILIDRACSSYIRKLDAKEPISRPSSYTGTAYEFLRLGPSSTYWCSWQTLLDRTFGRRFSGSGWRSHIGGDLRLHRKAFGLRSLNPGPPWRSGSTPCRTCAHSSGLRRWQWQSFASDMLSAFFAAGFPAWIDPPGRRSCWQRARSGLYQEYENLNWIYQNIISVKADNFIVSLWHWQLRPWLRLITLTRSPKPDSTIKCAH
jgi:hypothetical protein